MTCLRPCGGCSPLRLSKSLKLSSWGGGQHFPEQPTGLAEQHCQVKGCVSILGAQGDISPLVQQVPDDFLIPGEEGGRRM